MRKYDTPSKRSEQFTGEENILYIFDFIFVYSCIYHGIKQLVIDKNTTRSIVDSGDYITVYNKASLEKEIAELEKYLNSKKAERDNLYKLAMESKI